MLTAPSRTAESLDAGHYVQLAASDGHRFRAYVVQPTVPPRAALVLLQIMDQRRPGASGRARTASSQARGSGVNRFARQMAFRFADAGYLVVCPSTFSRGWVARDYGYRYDNLSWEQRLHLPLEPLPSDAVLLDVEAAIAHAQSLRPASPVGLVGYCWGGLLAWQAAARSAAVRAAVCHYGGGIESEAERERQPRCPVLLHWPQDGRWTSPSGIDAFCRQQGSSAASQVSSHHYAAPYGFMQPTRREYDADAAELAHQRTLDFLARHLPAQAPQPPRRSAAG